MKKVLALVLATFMAVTFVACGDSSSSTTAAAEAVTAATEAKTEAATDTNKYAALDGLTIEWLTPNDAGDLFDTSVRLYIQYLKDILPNTNFQVVNMSGGGGVTAYNYIYKADTVTMGSGAIPTMFSMQCIAVDEAVQYDVNEFNWIAYNDDDTRIIVAGSVKGYEDVYDFIEASKSTTLLAGAYGKGGQGWNEDVAIDYGLNLHSRFVAGYNSSTILLALLQGEIDYTCGSYSNYKTNIESGELTPLLVLEKERSEECPDVPTIYELVEEIGGDNAEMAINLINSIAFPKLTFASPSTTEEQYTALCAAFDELMQNEELMSQCVELGLHIPTTTGYELSAEIQSQFDGYFENEEELSAIFQKYLDENN